MNRSLLLSVTLAAILLLLGPFAALAQEPIKFGQIDSKDLTAAPFVGDSAAAAVVLCDFGRSRMEGRKDGLQVVFERVTRIKILKKAGYEEATVEIPLYHRDGQREKVSNLRGFTYNLVNGQVVKTKLEASGTFEEKRTPNVNVQKFTLPNVRAGSVIEYAYTLRSDFLFNFQDWTFQRTIPVRWSEYRASLPTFYKYKIIYQGNRPLTVDKSHVGSTSLRIEQSAPSAGTATNALLVTAPTAEYQWVLENVAAFREEAYMTAADDYVARLDFQLVGEQWPDQPYTDLTDSWPKINARLLNDEGFGQQLDRAGFLKAPVLALAKRHAEPAARAAAVRELIMANIRYDGSNRYASETSLRKAYEAHRGSAADVNLLLIAALRAAGLPAQPVLLSTRNHGRVDQQFPLLSKFNYVVALVPLAGGQDLLVDATEPLLPCGVLPERCLNRVGRLIPAEKDAEGRWVDLAPTQRHVRYQQVALVLDARGGLTGKVHEEHGGYAAADVRAGLATAGEKKYLAALLRRHDNWVVPKLAVGQAAAADKPLTLDYEFSQPATDQSTARTLYLSPVSEFSAPENPFPHDARHFNIDFGAAQDETIMVTLALPAGYELAEIPKPAVVDLPDGGGRFLYSLTVNPAGTVQITSRLSLRKTVYEAGQYANLRELYRLMLAKQGEKLIIQKKAGG